MPNDASQGTYCDTFFQADFCAVCAREWTQGQTPVPTVYTDESIESDDLPAPICDHCVEKEDAELFAELMRERELFWRS